MFLLYIKSTEAVIIWNITFIWYLQKHKCNYPFSILLCYYNIFPKSISRVISVQATVLLAWPVVCVFTDTRPLVMRTDHRHNEKYCVYIALAYTYAYDLSNSLKRIDVETS